MKRFTYFLFVIILLASCQTDPVVDSAFSKYSGYDGVVSITVPGFLVQTAVAFADLEPEERQLLKHVDKVKVLTIDDDYHSRKINFYSEFAHTIDTHQYTELLSLKEDEDQVKVWARMVDDKEINDLIILVGGDDNALVYVKGDFTVDQIARVANQYNEGKSFTELFDH